MSRECYFHSKRHTQLKVVQNNEFKIEMEAANKKELLTRSLAQQNPTICVCRCILFFTALVQCKAIFTSHKSHFTMPFIDKQCSRALIKPTS